jgi:hypothetical protein
VTDTYTKVHDASSSTLSDQPVRPFLDTTAIARTGL